MVTGSEVRLNLWPVLPAGVTAGRRPGSGADTGRRPGSALPDRCYRESADIAGPNQWSGGMVRAMDLLHWLTTDTRESSLRAGDCGAYLGRCIESGGWKECATRDRCEGLPTTATGAAGCCRLCVLLGRPTRPAGPGSRCSSRSNRECRFG